MNVAVHDTRTRILDSAEALVQTLGYDGFSYSDVSEAVGIRKASIHHHFPTKGDLGLAVIERFRLRCHEGLGAIDRTCSTPGEKLRQYTQLFEATLKDGGKMCLCGILAAGKSTLPDDVRLALQQAVQAHELWLTNVFRDGQAAGEFRITQLPKCQARMMFSCLEGAMLMARLHGDVRQFRAVVLGFIQNFKNRSVELHEK